MGAPGKKILNEINSNIPLLIEKLKDGIDEYNNYCEVLKFNEFNENLNDTEDQSIKKAESIYDRLDEMLRRNDLANTKLNETVVVLSNTMDLINNIIKIIENEREGLALRNNELIDVIIDLEKRKVDKLIIQYPKRQNGLKGSFEDLRNEWNEHRINFEENRKKQEEVMKITNNTIDKKEMKKLEKWTRMKIRNVIFDSNIDDWNINTSVFHQRIINKSNLIFIIEDDDGNKFGGYVNVNIHGCGNYINDPKSFVFSLKSNGRLNGMFKFDITNIQHAFYLNSQSSASLFGFGSEHDICTFKENKRFQSYCKQTSFDYDGIQNALCGKSLPDGFTTKRITVIQLI